MSNCQDSTQEKNQSYFQRAKRDREHPYVMISKNMFRDPNISPKAKGVLGYLLCFPDDWKVNPQQVAKALNVGRDFIYNAIKELEKFGYCKRTQAKNEIGQFSNLIYEFSEEPIFLTHTSEEEKPEPVFPDSEKEELQNNNSTEYRKNKKKVETTVPTDSDESVSSPSANDVFVFFLDLLKKQNPKFKEPNKKKWLFEIDRIMRIDKRTSEELKKVIKWAFSQEDEFWPNAIQSPKTLRKLFDRAWVKLNHKTQQERDKEVLEAKENCVTENKNWCKSFLKTFSFKNRQQRIEVCDTCVWIHNYGETIPIGYAEPNLKEIVLNKLKTWGMI